MISRQQHIWCDNHRSADIQHDLHSFSINRSFRKLFQHQFQLAGLDWAPNLMACQLKLMSKQLNMRNDLERVQEFIDSFRSWGCFYRLSRLRRSLLRSQIYSAYLIKGEATHSTERVMPWRIANISSLCFCSALIWCLLLGRSITQPPDRDCSEAEWNISLRDGLAN